MDYRPPHARWTSVVAVLALVALVGALVLAGWLALRQEGPLSSLGLASQPGVLHLGLSQPLHTLDPALAAAPSDRAVQAMVYEGVVAPGADGTLALEPRLAEALPLPSADGLVWTIACRRRVRFHDGQPFTCLDVQARLESLRAAKTALAGSDIDPATLIALLERIESIQAVDNYTLNVRLREPFAFFNEALAHPAAVIVRDGYGTGPFEVESWDTEGARLTAFDDYWGGPPELAGVTVQVVPEQATRLALLGDQFDAVDDPPPNAPLDENDQLMLSVPGAQVIFVAVNRSTSPLDNPQIRQALSAGLDPQALAAQVYAGRARPAPILTSPAMPGYDSLALPDPDLRLARELQANSGLPDGYDATVHVDRRISQWQGLSEALRIQLGELYIEGNAEALRVPLEEAFFSTDPPLPLVVTARTPLDAYAALGWLAEAPPPEGDNFVGYDNPTYRAWVQQASAALTVAARETALDGARGELEADPPLVALLSPDVLVAASAEVSGLRVSPLGWMVVTRETLLLHP